MTATTKVTNREEVKQQLRETASKKSQQQLSDWLVKVGAQKGAKTQLKMADLLLDDRGGFCTLAQTICAQQSHKLAQWGDKTFPMTQAQCMVVAREFLAQ